MDVRKEIDHLVSPIHLISNVIPEELNDLKYKLWGATGNLLKELGSSTANVANWSHIKQILEQIISILNIIISYLKDGSIKMILQGIISAINIIISSLPNG
jgi:hypothetical protein